MTFRFLRFWSTLLLVLFAGLAFAHPVSAQITWNELLPNGNESSQQAWEASAMSADGTILIVARNNYSNNQFELYRSDDEGWNKLGLSSSLAPWKTVSMSADGQIILAGNTDNLFRSMDGGLSWEEVLAGQTNGYWLTSDMSLDGTVMLAGTASNGRLYRSLDQGETWSETQPAGDIGAWWLALAVSDSGGTLVASDSQNIYRSADGGLNWTAITPSGGGLDVRAVCMGADGNRILSASRSDASHVFLSADSGNSWQAVVVDASLETNPFWQSCSMSNDGQSIVLAGSGWSTEGGEEITGRLYFSEDSGQTWVETQPLGDVTHWWSTSSMSQNGRMLFVAGGSGDEEYIEGVYLGSLPLPPSASPTPAASSETGGPRASRPKPPRCEDGRPPSTPNLFQIDVNNTQATVYFAPVPNADRYYISYGDGTTTGQYGVEFVTGNSSGVIGYTINQLAPGQQYSFLVRGGNGCMPGDWGNTMTVRTRRTPSGGQSYYKDFVSRVLSVFPQQIIYIEGQRQVLGAKTPALQAGCQPQQSFVKPDDPIFEHALTNFGALSVFQAFEQVIDLASLLFNPQFLPPQQSFLTEQACTSHT